MLLVNILLHPEKIACEANLFFLIFWKVGPSIDNQINKIQNK